MRERSPYLAGLLLAGLALAPGIARADIRIEERSTTLDSTATRWIYIKGDKRSIVTKTETTGALYNAGARYGAYVEIARPDKELIWEVDPQERSYREITPAQFTKFLQKGIQAPRNGSDQPLRSLYKADTTAVEVRPTGETKRIAGFPAEQVVARVVVEAQNQVTGNQLRFTFDQELWITRDEQVMREVKGFEDAYVDAFGSAVTLAQAKLMSGEWNDAFITHLRAMNDKIRALGGYPLVTNTTVTEEALAQSKGEKGTSRKLVVGSTDVRKISLDTIPDGEFELPAGYINADTKVAVGGPSLPHVDPGVTGTSPIGPRVAAAPATRPAPAPTTVAKASPSETPAAVRSEAAAPTAPEKVRVAAAPHGSGSRPSAASTTPLPPPPVTGTGPALALNVRRRALPHPRR